MKIKPRTLLRIVRSVIDAAAIYAAWSIQFAASGSLWASAITAAGVALYGLWCFADGFSYSRAAI